MKPRINIVLFLLVIFTCNSLSLSAQETPKRMHDDFNDLILLIDDNSFHHAVSVGKQLVDLKPENANFT